MTGAIVHFAAKHKRAFAPARPDGGAVLIAGLPAPDRPRLYRASGWPPAGP